MPRRPNSLQMRDQEMDRILQNLKLESDESPLAEAMRQSVYSLLGDTDPDKNFVFTIIPPKEEGVTRDDNPDGWTVCFVDGIAKRTILNTPGFPRPLLHPTRASYWVTTAQHMGLGLFAKRLIKMGEIILSERPLIIVPDTIDATLRQFGEAADEEARLGLMKEWERSLENCVNMMDEKNRQELLKLRNAYEGDGSGPYLGIVRTNGYEVKPLKFKQGQIEDGYSAICKDIARINHSCRPNAVLRFDMPSFSFQLFAARKIPSYEQICINYCDILLPAAERQEQLARKKLTCTCPACKGDTSKGDTLRTSLEGKTSEVQTMYRTWSKNFTLPDNYVLEPALNLITAIEDEDLEKVHVYGKLLVVINNVYTALGDLDNAVRYGKMVSAWHKKDYGPENLMIRLEDPRYYPTRPEWNIRAGKSHSPRGGINIRGTLIFDLDSGKI